MAKAPSIYVSQRSALGFDSVSYGYGGIELFEADQLDRAQVGYSVSKDGKSLTGDGKGAWRENWFVVGRETTLGDPIFLSTDAPHAVYTAIHGEGSWNHGLIAPDLEAFWRCLAVFRKHAKGRGTPIELEENPPGEDEVEEYGTRICECCGEGDDAVDFWAGIAEFAD